MSEPAPPEAPDPPPRPGGARRIIDFLLPAAALSCVALLAYGGLTRRAGMSPDTAVYVDAARHFAAGEGLQRGILMLFQPEHMAGDAMSVPLTLYAPLYPLTVSIPLTLGVPGPLAALAVSMLFLILLAIVAYALTRSLYDAATAALALGVLLHCGPFLFVAGHAWSEPMAIAFLLAGFLALSKQPPETNRVAWHCLVAGILLGLAFATRYALLPALLVVMAWTLFQHGRRLRRSAALLAGFTLPGGAVVLRNLAVQGRPFGPPRGPSGQGILQNLSDVWKATAETWLPPDYLAPENQLRVLACIVVLAAGAAVLLRRGCPLWDSIFRGPRILLPLWSVVYLSFLVFYRSRYDMDPIGPRLVLPGIVPLLLAATGWAAAVVQTHRALLRAAALALVLAACARESVFLHAAPALSPTAHADLSERMRWVCENTTPLDLIVGDRTYDIPLFCGLRKGLCFFPDETPDQHLTPQRLRAFLEPRRGRFDRCFIVLSRVTFDEPVFESEWRRLCGDFLTDLVYGRAGEWPGVRGTARLRDGYVFEVDTARFLE